MKRILHLADLHISDSATIAGRVRRAASGRNLAIKDVLDSIIDIINNIESRTDVGQVDGIVIAGDFFDAPRPTPDELMIGAQLLTTLVHAAKSGEVLLIPGNHDLPRSVSEQSAVMPLGWCRGVRLIEQPQVVDYAGLKIGCLPYPRRAAIREFDASANASNAVLSGALQVLATEMVTQGANILVAHCSVGGATVGQQPRSIEGDIELPRETLELFNAVLLGHIHKQQAIQSHVRYAGSPTVNDFGEVGESKGACLWTFEDDGRLVNVEPISFEGRAWGTINLQPGDDLSTWPCLQVLRVRGDLPLDEITVARQTIHDWEAAGAFVQDELRVAVEDRMRDAEVGRTDITDAEILKRALVARKIAEGDIARLVELHQTVEQEGGAR